MIPTNQRNSRSLSIALSLLLFSCWCVNVYLYTFFFYKKPGEGPSSKSFLIFLVKNEFLISIKVASSESFLKLSRLQ